MSIKLQNQTFRSGEIEFNACVGTNGMGDIRTYAEGYLEVTQLLLEDLIKNRRWGQRDTWVFPIIFSARHGVELTLKEILILMVDVRPTVKVDLRFVRTHDLSLLWNELKDKSSLLDRRYKDILMPLEEHIQDYVSIDPTGQTFRYPNDKYKTRHLKDTPLLNLAIFYERFKVLKSLLDDLYYLTLSLREEYSLGTYTTQLSRLDLDRISKKLPRREKWQDNYFDTIREEICKEYSIGKNQFSKALNVIQAHPTFSSHIGVIIPLRYATEQHLRNFLEIFEKLHPTKNKDEDMGHAYIQDASIRFDELKASVERKQAALKLIKELPTEVIAEIGCLFHLGRDYRYCEFYEKALKEQLNKINQQDLNEYIVYYIDKTSFKRNVILGLEILGQTRAIQALN